MKALTQWRLTAVATALVLGPLVGAFVARRPTVTLVLCLAVLAVLALALLGDRAFAWAIVAVVVAPWYPLIAQAAGAPVVSQKVLCAAVAAAPLAPWLWSVASVRRRSRASRGALVLGLLFAGFAVLIYETRGGISPMIHSSTVGFLFAGVTFLCARRFATPRDWLAPCFAGWVVLALLGLVAYAGAPDNRIGYFTGYPITYGALVVGLVPGALLFAARRSRVMAAGVALLSIALLIFSQSRSSWVAAIAILLVVLAVNARRGNLRVLGYLGAATAVALALILSTGALHRVVERSLSSNVRMSDSVTHRLWSYGYATDQIGHRPFFGAGTPGFSSQQVANETSIGAIDNGYLSIAVDMGLIGLAAAVVPIVMALWLVLRCLRLGIAPREDLALALGVLGMAAVTVFYDGFYWAQIDLLMFGMGGVLSARLGVLPRLPLAWRARLAPASGSGRILGAR